MAEQRFEFDVAVTDHDKLSKGILIALLLNIEVMAETHTEAFFIAYAMGMCAMKGATVTDIWDRI